MRTTLKYTKITKSVLQRIQASCISRVQKGFQVDGYDLAI